ncbi:MAG: Ger(x)C family spore germination C-terminal domain-containing protein [Oscillospiraceae bacterium]
MKKILPFLLLFPLLLSGCEKAGDIRENYREISQLQLIQTIGLDSSRQGVTLTVASGKQSDGSPPAVVSREARSVVEAINSVQDYDAAEQVFFAHVQYAVAGEEYARQGLGHILDFIERDVRMRMGTELFVLKGATAKDLITGPGSDSFNINSVLDAVKRDVNYRGDSHVFSIRETVRSLDECGAALVCALNCVDTEGTVFLTETGLSAVPDGYAILKDARLVGFLDSRDAEGASLLLDKLGAAVLSVEDGKGGRVTLEATGSGVRIKPQWAADGSLECIKVEAELKAAVAEIDDLSAPLETEEYISALESALSQDMKKRIISALDASSRLDADFLNLAAVLRRDDREKFEALPEDWLRGAVFQVSVKSAVDRSYDLGDPTKADRSGK